MSNLPAADVVRIQRWCSVRVPERVQDQVRVEAQVDERHVTIVERRPPWSPDADPEWTVQPIARLRYTKSTRLWALYWADRNDRFHQYQQLPAHTDVQRLLAEIERDPTAIFWG